MHRKNSYPHRSLSNRTFSSAAQEEVPGSGLQILPGWNVCHQLWCLSNSDTPNVGWPNQLAAPVDALRDGRYASPGPSVTCIDPKLTVLRSSPPASSSSEEGESIDGDRIASEDLPHDSRDAHPQRTHTFAPNSGRLTANLTFCVSF
jgi:hypothetical protein